MPQVIVRTYETVSIRWADGARWSGGMDRTSATATILHARDHGSGREGVIEVEEWEVEIDPSKIHLYQNTHIAERIVQVA